MSRISSKPLHFVLFALMLLVYCSYYYPKMYKELPARIHEWAQADRYSLAINFYDRGMNFFLPATNNQNSINGVVGVEFPIQAYLAAALGHIFGREHISECFRLLDILISCTGLLFLFLTCYKATKDFIFSILPPFFIFCSPVFIFYSGGYMPDTAAAACAFIAFYYVYSYIAIRPSKRDFIMALIFLTLGTLIKTSVGVYLLGFIGYAFIRRVLYHKKFDTKESVLFFIISLFAIAIPIAYYFYNKHLNETYKSTLFLSKIMMFENDADVQQYINNFKGDIGKQYLVQPQYAMFVAVVAAGIVCLYNSAKGKKLLLLTSIFLLGALSMGILMGHQLIVHDYYFVSIFLPFIAFAFLVSTIAIREQVEGQLARRAMRTGIFASLLIVSIFAGYRIELIMKPNYMPFAQWYRHYWMEKGAVIMDELHIPKEEKILALNELAPNLTLVYFDRKGYIYPWMDWDRKNAAAIEQYMHERNVKIMVCEDQIATGLENETAGIFHNFKLLTKKDQVAVYQLMN